MSNEPKFGRIPDALRRCGLSRGKLYGIAAQHEGLFLKAGAATVVDLRKLDKVLAGLPPAQITASQSDSGKAA